MKYFLLLIAICIKTLVHAQTPIVDFKYQDGDLLFQDIDCGDLCDAIETVTPSLNGKHFSHIGMVHLKADSVFVIEAIGKDVHLTPISKFLNRQLDVKNNPKVVVGRLSKQYRAITGKAVTVALTKLGTPYDDVFIYNNGKYYCSELVYDAFKEANGNRPFFTMQPMTFNDPKTGQLFPAWKTYYNQLKIDIPEGKQGCNPGSIATDKKIMIVQSFY